MFFTFYCHFLNLIFYFSITVDIQYYFILALDQYIILTERMSIFEVASSANSI